jgi:hypothetical protein
MLRHRRIARAAIKTAVVAHTARRLASRHMAHRAERHRLV